MIFVRAPFRIPLGGGGTDLPSYYSKFGGQLISAAINKYMYVTVNRPIVDKLIRVKYTKTEIVENVKQVDHELVKEALKITNIKDSIEINSIADVPAGTGMGSSGSYLVALLKALHTINREDISTKQIAEEACRIEIEKLKRPVGKQDQYMAAFGGVTKLLISKTGRVNVKRIGLSSDFLRDMENNLLVFYTGIRREGKQILKNQSKATSNNNRRVVENLHIIKAIGLKIEKALIEGEIETFGKLMHEHWMSKKQLSSAVSTSRIDKLYNLGIENGALGGKIMGAGGGGFLMFCCPGDKKSLRNEMRRQGLSELIFNFDMEGVKVVANI